MDTDQQQPKDRLEEYLLLCEQLYERLQREGKWPWKADSTKSNDAVDSIDNRSSA